jgi:hypothetical protein
MPSSSDGNECLATESLTFSNPSPAGCRQTCWRPEGYFSRSSPLSMASRRAQPWRSLVGCFSHRSSRRGSFGSTSSLGCWKMVWHRAVGRVLAQHSKRRSNIPGRACLNILTLIYSSSGNVSHHLESNISTGMHAPAKILRIQSRRLHINPSSAVSTKARQAICSSSSKMLSCWVNPPNFPDLFT